MHMSWLVEIVIDAKPPTHLSLLTVRRRLRKQLRMTRARVVS